MSGNFSGSTAGSSYLYGGNSSATTQANLGVNKEDLLDQIINIDPFDTPWVSQAPKTTAKHVYHQWLTDTLGDTVTTGTAVEGEDYSYSSMGSAPARQFNITNILRQDIGASETQRAVDSAGFSDLYAYELQKATKRLAIKLEKLVLAGGGSTATGDATHARVMKTFKDFITTNTSYAGTNPQGIPGGSALGTAQGGSVSAGLLTSGDFNDMLEKIYKAGGNPEQVYVSPKVKRQISAFTSVGGTADTPMNRTIAASDKKLISSIDFYDTDFGIIQIVLDRWMPEGNNTATAGAGAASSTAGCAYFLQRSMNRLAWLRPMTHQFIGKRGDSVAGIIVGEVTLEVLSEKANGAITSINNYSHVTKG